MRIVYRHKSNELEIGIPRGGGGESCRQLAGDPAKPGQERIKKRIFAEIYTTQAYDENCT
jgi:hypothetical protein